MDNLTQYLQLGAVAILFLVSIREFFAYLRVRKAPNGTDKDILKELQLLNENHLNSICKEINEGNSDIVTAIKQMNNDLGDKLDNINSGISRLLGRSDFKR